jgi:hypothetical protein
MLYNAQQTVKIKKRRRDSRVFYQVNRYYGWNTNGTSWVDLQARSATTKLKLIGWARENKAFVRIQFIGHKIFRRVHNTSSYKMDDYGCIACYSATILFGHEEAVS